MIRKLLQFAIALYVDSTLHGALNTVQGGVRHLLFGASLLLAGGILVIFSTLMLMVGFFLHFAHMSQFLGAAAMTASIGLALGVPLVFAGISMSKLTRKSHPSRSLTKT